MKMSRLFGGSAALAAATIVTLAGTARSAQAQPANDQCFNAILVTPGTYSGSTAAATNDGSASCGSSSTNRDVWYKVTPTEDAMLVAATCGSSYDTVISIHTGCPGDESNQVACNDDACDGTRSSASASVTAGETYLIRVSGWSTNSGSFTLTISYLDPPPPGSGPDVTFQNVNGIAHYTAVGGVVAYALGTDTCNIGAQDLLWTSGGTPGIGFNMYRVHDGRIMQLGQSWAKIACCAAAHNGGCGSCNNNGGSVLGAGCRDVYGASYNGGHSGLRPRSKINAWTGQFSGTIDGPTGSIDRRLQVQVADLSPTTYPGAQYFVEGVYVADDEAPEQKMNNASYSRVTVSGTNLAVSGATQSTIPAIYAWRDHGLGANTPDPSVIIQDVDVPDEGRFVVGHKVSDNGDGTWRYEYAVFNLNSDRSGGSFSVPVGEGVTVSNVGFHDVPYHSGEPYDNTDWAAAVGSGSVSWTSPQSFEQNANSNALRWGTMYNFWFDADAAPAEAQATLGLFRPGTPDAVTLSVGAPAGGGSCPADWDGDGAVNSGDISAFLTSWIDSVQAGDLVGDFDASGQTNSGDISAFLTAWIVAVTEGC